MAPGDQPRQCVPLLFQVSLAAVQHVGPFSPTDPA